MRFLYASLATAILLNLAAAPLSQGYVALIAFLPLLTLQDRPARQRFFLGWLSGFSFQAIGFYWIFYTVRDFGGLNEGLSLLGGTLFWLFQGLDLALFMLIFPLLHKRDAPLLNCTVAAATFYAIQHLFPYVFPWVYGTCIVQPAWLGASSAFWTDHGLSFLALWFQAGILAYRQQRTLPTALLNIALPALLFALGGLGQTQTPTRTWRVGIVQPSIIPLAKRDQLSPEEIFMKHYERSIPFVNQKLDLIVWPETAANFPLNGALFFEEKIRNLAEAANAAVITGAIERDAQGRYYNSVFLYAPGAAEPQIYRKTKLVLFSETIPWVLSWSRFFVPGLGGLSPGMHEKPFTYRGTQIIPLVCFEALYSNYIQEFSGQLMVNVTNDAWFGVTKASSQHLQHVRMRSIEAGIPLVRATNSGISCWVDPQGRVQNATPLYQEASPVFEVPVPIKTPQRANMLGAALARYGSLAALAWALFARLRAKKKLG